MTTIQTNGTVVSVDPLDVAAEKNAAANELFSLSELPDGVVGDLAQMFRSTDEDEVWRDYCLQFLGSALERTDGVTDPDPALARETLISALSSTNATFAGTALRALHRGDPANPLVASNALRIARDPSVPAPSRSIALAGHTVEVVDFASVTNRFDYDALGQRTSATDGRGNTADNNGKENNQ